MDFNLKDLEKKIAERKEEKIKEMTKTPNFNVAENSQSFLGKLMESVNTGRENHATEKIKKVDRVAEGKKPSGVGLPEEIIQETVKQKPQNRPQNRFQEKPQYQYNPQDEQKMNEAMRNANVGLVDSVERYTGTQQYPQTQYSTQPNQYAMQPPVMNENVVISHVNSFLNENATKLFEDAMQNAIVEIYSKDRVMKIIDEIKDDLINEDDIKEIVYKTILELQERRKAKK
jgi:flagellar biosynthesis component FlhA